MADPVAVLYTRTAGGVIINHRVTLTGMAGQVFYPTVQGTGDAELNCNFGSLCDPVFAIPTPGVPLGVFPGALTHAGYFETLAPGNVTLNYGSGQPSSQTFVRFDTVYGLCQATDGWSQGSWCFEATVRSIDLFSSLYGIGWARAYNGGAGLDPNQYAFFGRYSGGDANGGAMIRSTGFNGFHPQFGAQGVNIATETSVQMSAGAVFGAAIFLPPFSVTTLLDRQKIQPVELPCIPCQPGDCCY